MSAVLGLTACQPAEYTRHTPFYLGILDASDALTVPQDSHALSLAARIHNQEDIHGPQTSSLEFVLPDFPFQPNEPNAPEIYGPRLSELLSLPEQDPQPFSHSLTNRFSSSHYLHSQILGIPFTLSSTGQPDHSPFFAGEFEQEFWTVEGKNDDSPAYPSSSKVWKVLRYLLFQGDDPVSKTYRSTMNTLAKASDTPVQFFLGPKSGLKIDLNYNKARLTVRLPLFETIFTDVEYEHSLFEDDKHSAIKLLMGLNF